MATVSKETEKGGFECEFVKKPPEDVQSKCPVCEQILREPYQTSCCGKSFCRVCIERIKTDNKPCPTCKEENFDTFHCKKLQNTLHGFQVYCSHKQEGCEWKGELGQLDNHLNLSPQPDEQLEGCEYSEIECIYCSELIKRPNITAHQTDLCPKTFIDCDFRHVGCDVRLPRKDMPAHLNENLVTHMSLQAASYSKLLASHNELQASHATLQASHIELQTSLEEKEERKNEPLATKMDKQTTTVRETGSNGAPAVSGKQGDKGKKVDKEEDSLKHQLEQAKRENKQTLTRMKQGLGVCLTLAVLAVALFLAFPSGQKELQATLQDNFNQLQLFRETDKQMVQQIIQHIALSTTTAEYYVELIMDNFEQHKEENDAWYSPPFYSHPQGYKLCLRVDANGYGSGEGTHIAVFAHLMVGEFDDILKWPFLGKVIVQLVDQEGGKDHIAQVIPFTDETPEEMAGRVTEGEKNEGWGYHKFVSHVELEQHFLKNDSLRFRVYRY